MKPTTEDVFAYLVALRDSGRVNMWGAVPYLEERFGMSKAEAKAALFAWMDSFKKATQ